ncbi:Cleavage and polyadenylation specificity factor subunit 2 [Glycine max]|nr:Cleavage and polyadenylation specificity factor subunit 2 [Glycine max]
MSNGKAVGADNIPIEVWKTLGDRGLEWLTELFNEIMRSKRMPEEWRRSTVSTSVRTQGGESDDFPITIGLHQGSTLSPYLFTLILDVLTEQIQEIAPRCMLFADDIVLLGESREELNERLETWRRALETHGFRLSRSKSEYMECKFNKRRRVSNSEVKIGDHIIPQVTRFKYLGSVIQDDGEIEGDVNHRIQAGWMKWRKASGVLCDAKVPIKLKGKFYRTAVRPAILYGTECWAVKSQHENKVGVAEMRMLRWMCGKTRQDKIRNEAIRERVGVAPIVEKMVENRLRWFGHVERRPVDSVVSRVDQMERRQTIRGRGRPKKTIREVIKKDLEINGLDRSMQVSGFDLFTLDDIDSAFQSVTRITYSQNHHFSGKGEGIVIAPHVAGHLLGGTIWKITKDGEDVIYAVDFNHRKERHLNGTVLGSFVRPAVLITDAYNALNNQPYRRQNDKEFGAGRLLELILMLELYWADENLNYPIYFLTYVASSTIDYVKSFLEWMSDTIAKSFEKTRENIFLLKNAIDAYLLLTYCYACTCWYVTLLINKTELDNAPDGPKVVLASMASLEAGFSHDIFVEWANDVKNLVLFTERGQFATLARMLQADPPPKAVKVVVSKCVPLVGKS